MPASQWGLMKYAIGYIRSYQKQSLHGKRLSLGSHGGKVPEEKRTNSTIKIRKMKESG